MNIGGKHKSFLWAVILAPWSVVFALLLFSIISILVTGQAPASNDVFPFFIISGIALLYAYVGMIVYGVPVALLLIYFKCKRLYQVILAALLPSVLFAIFMDDGMAIAPYFGMFSALVAGVAWLIAEWLPHRRRAI